MRLSEQINLGCACRTLDADRLYQRLPASLAHTHPHLFSDTAVFIDPATREAIVDAVNTLDAVTRLPGYRQTVLARTRGMDAPTSKLGPDGVFMGYDFHLGEEDPRLIEINTNAGGALLCAELLRAQQRCCIAAKDSLETLQLEQRFLAMFRSEWQAQRGTLPWRTAAVIDENPQQQFLAPEFELVRQLFESQGIRTIVADPRELEWHAGALWHPSLPRGLPIDLVYNRLTDFSLSSTSLAALREAYRAGAVVLTPHPWTHALHADKRNLVWFGDDALMARCGADERQRSVLRAVVPATRMVRPADAETLWHERRKWFFKPTDGYASKGVYRGDKLTRRTWKQILAGGFVAQTRIPPSERLVCVEGVPKRFRVDIRAYAYRGEVLLLAARIYSGQTTNLRTPGGGFAPVLTLPCGDIGAAHRAADSLPKELQ